MIWMCCILIWWYRKPKRIKPVFYAFDDLYTRVDWAISSMAFTKIELSEEVFCTSKWLKQVSYKDSLLEVAVSWLVSCWPKHLTARLFMQMSQPVWWSCCFRQCLEMKVRYQWDLGTVNVAYIRPSGTAHELQHLDADNNWFRMYTLDIKRRLSKSTRLEKYELEVRARCVVPSFFSAHNTYPTFLPTSSKRAKSSGLTSCIHKKKTQETVNSDVF